MKFTEVFIGKVIQVYPDQGWGILQSCRYPDSEAVFLLRDQRGLDKRGNIDPEKIRTSVPKNGTIIKFTIDRNKRLPESGMVFLWARKNPLQAHFYPYYDQPQETCDLIRVAVPAPTVVQLPNPEVSGAEKEVEKSQDQKTTDNATRVNQPEIKKPAAQNAAHHSAEKTQKTARDSGYSLPSWAAEKGVAILKGKGKIRLGTVGS